ncbi:MAG: acetate kinase [Ignavibacteria bacterium GWB2_35_12]|nr:MAG: acetate kinase [Ignavibacteria bacterium GWA2_35_8]OGU41610.1 MAG: acetate kinase [Ignavibacteria bacterium GWB2_35_12]OGU91349.1 MAG: acetate kinase [Ignavibacteria bacterium RIFOXYA2_FULL_35_10]OGV24943.1 MAG: acetate kinase [Ignavibacteria bacterium RIFOXYC2_FULL_35_21]
MNIFVLNCGSSSLKFQIIETDLDLIKDDKDRTLAKGLIERVGSQAIISFQVEGQPPLKQAAPLRDHRAALNYVIKWITDPETEIPGIRSLEDIHAIGHRVVHGEERFKKSVRIDKEVIAGIEDCIDLAPLHNPANLKGIYAAREQFGPSTPQVAVFDTSFHSTMPEISYLYAIPYQTYRRFKVRKYGFHGTSHRYISYRYRKLTGKEREDTNIITLHLGNGSSACAIKGGNSLDTSMGMTPLDGLMMGTRCGDIDPTVIEYLMHKEGTSIDEVFSVLNKRSGVLGISGLTNDMRDLLDEIKEHQDRRAILAVEMFCGKVRKYIGAYTAEMNGADAICFAGGIGENSPEIRKKIITGLDWLGIELDDSLNEQAYGGKAMKISSAKSRVEIFVIPTNEELILARDTLRVVLNVPRIW